MITGKPVVCFLNNWRSFDQVITSRLWRAIKPSTVTAAMRSEDPFKKVGACALGDDNKVLALGYNGLASGKELDPEKKKKFWEDRDFRRPFVIHAEANCLSGIKRGECNIFDSTLLTCS